MASPAIESRFLRTVESMARAMEMAEVPMLIFVGPTLDDYVDQASAALGGTVVYTSQNDFLSQVLASLRQPAHLFVVVDQPLSGRSFELIHACLMARDVMGADPSELSGGFGSPPPHADHRLILLLEQATLLSHSVQHQRVLLELSTRIAVRGENT